jgi:tetratricopeptide (TPR) repeat protein
MQFDRIDELNQQVVQLYQQGDYNQAIIIAEQALELARHMLGTEHPDVAASLNNLARLYKFQGRYREAEQMYLQSLAIMKRLLGEEHLNEEHLNVANNLNNLAGLYEAQGRYKEAEQMYLQSLAIMKCLLGEEHLNVATSLNNLAALYKSQGRYSEAAQMYLQSLVIKKRLLGKEHPTVANGLNNLALLYEDQGHYSEAEQNYLEALAMRKRLLGEEHPDVAASLNNLAALYKSQGRYSEAEQNYLKALAMRKRLLGEEHPDVAASLNNLAALYDSQGRYSEAEQNYLEALEICKRLLGNQHLNVATSLNNLAALYKSQGRYSEAEQNYLEALAIFKRLFEENHPTVATSLNNIAEFYDAQGNYNEAEQLYLEALAIWKRIVKDEHPAVAASLNNLAGIYFYQGRYSEAEQNYLEAFTIWKRLLGHEHPNLAACLNNLALLFAATNRPTQALSQMLLATKIDDKTIHRVFAFSSESDRLAYLQSIRHNFDVLLSLVHNHLCDYPQARQTALDLVLKRKALTASTLAVQNQTLYSGRYPHLTEEFRKLRDLSEQIIHLTFSTSQTKDFTTYQQQLAQLQDQHNNLQKFLASQVPEIQLQEQAADRRAVALELPADSTLVEFVRFRVGDFIAKKAQPARYLAFILPAGQPEAVQMIDIGEAKPIERLIQEFRELVSTEAKNLGNQLGIVRHTPKLFFRDYHPEAGIRLRQALFDKLRPYLKERQHLLIAPDGELYLVPFQILPSDDTGEKMLMDEFTITYLTVGRDILRQKIETKRPASLNALVFASPNFDLSAESITSDAAQEANMQTANLRELIANKLLKPAVGTNILGERVAHRLKVASYLGDEALERYFKPIQCPRILLVATHGVFLPNQPKDSSLSVPYQRESSLLQRDRFFGRVENPMLRSALALAGANTWAKGGKLPPEAGKGILFAQDVAGLDLWANEITVLSACETAIGDVAIGEGVFGLRRAFAVAGAKTLIMSLWSVNGWATALLMERFFDNCEAGLGRGAALQEAQNYVRNITVGELQQFELGREILKYEFNNGRELDAASLAHQAENKPLAHPYYWGAWICQGDTKAVEMFKNTK